MYVCVCVAQKTEKEKERRKQTDRKTMCDHKIVTVQGDKRWHIAGNCNCLILSRPALQTNVGHIFHWEWSGHEEDEPHFQLSHYNTIQGG